jgi:hypothetical protein
LTLVIYPLSRRFETLTLEVMKRLLLAVIAAAMLSAGLFATDINVGGNWEMTMDSPHGKMTGPLTLQQDGTKLTGAFETEHTGKLPLNGKVDGGKILFSIEAPGGQMTIDFEGTKQGDKLTGTTKPLNGEWSAVHK